MQLSYKPFFRICKYVSVIFYDTQSISQPPDNVTFARSESLFPFLLYILKNGFSSIYKGIYAFSPVLCVKTPSDNTKLNSHALLY